MLALLAEPTMAYVSYVASVTSAGIPSAGRVASPSAAVALQATLDAAQAAAVAKGAADASAEIATVGVALTAYEAAVNAAASGSVLVSFTTTLTKNQARLALREVLRQIEGDAILSGS